MFVPDLVVRSRRTVFAGGARPAAVHIHHGKIVGVMDFDAVPGGCPLDDAGDLVLMPGVVDTHVHATGQDRAEREDVESLTRAAASGGITTIVDAAATTTAAALIQKQSVVEGHSFVDVGFWGGIVPGNGDSLAGLAAAGVRGFKCALAASSIDGFPAVTEPELRNAIPLVAKLGVQLLVHAELPGPLARAAEASRASRRWISRLTGSTGASRKYAAYLATLPKEAENEGIALAIELCRAYRVRTHILHLSSSDALTPLYHARASRLPISAETCPHYLTFVAEEIPDGATAFRCDPPIRERENREYLWASLAGGLIQLVASNHPHVSSVQQSLAATWTEARPRGYSLNHLVDWMCRAPARLAALDRKGTIDVGFDADLAIWNPELECVGEGAYAGRRLFGVVERTYLRGARVYARGQPPATAAGRPL